MYHNHSHDHSHSHNHCCNHNNDNDNSNINESHYKETNEVIYIYNFISNQYITNINFIIRRLILIIKQMSNY